MIHDKINTESNHEIRGQYAFDNLQGDQEKSTADATGTLDMRGDGSFSFHQKGLWDETDHFNPDEATGQVDKSPSDHEENELRVHDGLGETALDLEMGMVGDEAARWLAAHDTSNRVS